MDLYTLSDQFLDKDIVDEFVSAIWTERYSAAGDVQLVVPATTEMIDKLSDGTYLALRGSKEVMILETQSIEDGLMTVVGETLPGFLNQRVAWFTNPDYDSASEGSPKIVDYTETTTAGQFLANVVDKMVIHPVAFSGIDYGSVNLDWEFETIAHLELGAVDTSGDPERFTIPIGPLYDGIQQLAEQEQIGFSLYLDVATFDTGYVLKFTTYRGNDLTSDQTVNPLVRLTPDLESLSDLKEIRSRANYKNVVYVYYQGAVSVHYAEPTLPKPEGFERRVLVTDAEGEPVGHKQQVDTFIGYGRGSYTQIEVGPADVAAFREQNAKDALANHNYILAIDGQTSPNNDYKFGVDYDLGDIIELEGLSGTLSKARVTEYIRSQDKTGERAYPTISVVT